MQSLLITSVSCRMTCSHTPMSVVLALLVMYSGIDCLVYHILPNPSDPCPTQPCLTLSQFASNTSSYIYLQSSATLTFQLGNHNLSSTFRVDGVSSLQLIATSILPLSANIICDCSSLDLYNITFVHISRLEFIGCSGNRGE